MNLVYCYTVTDIVAITIGWPERDIFMIWLWDRKAEGEKKQKEKESQQDNGKDRMGERQERENLFFKESENILRMGVEKSIRYIY